MNTQQFIEKLEARLRSIPKQEAKERISFYLEMIDDRIEEGLSEEEAVAGVGSIEDIAEQILSEYSKAQKGNKSTAKKLSGFEWAIIIIGSPIWLPLLIAAGAIIGAVYIVIWAVMLAIWAVEAPFLIFSYISKYLLIFCKKATKYTALFTKKSFNWCINLLKKGDKQI